MGLKAYIKDQKHGSASVILKNDLVSNFRANARHGMQELKHGPVVLKCSFFGN